MVKKSNSNKSSQLARAYMLSFPQLMVWALIFAFVGGLTVWTSLAAPRGGGGKPPKGGTGTISLVMANDQNGDGLPNWNDKVTFNISTASTTQPWVNLKCYQNNVLVAQGWNGFFDGSLTGRIFGLASPQWTSGPADCTAYLTTPQWAVLASTSFHVNP